MTPAEYGTDLADREPPISDQQVADAVRILASVEPLGVAA